MTAPKQLRAVKTLVRVTLSDSFKIKPRTEVSSPLIVQPAAKIQSPEPRVGGAGVDRMVDRTLITVQALCIEPTATSYPFGSS